MSFLSTNSAAVTLGWPPELKRVYFLSFTMRVDMDESFDQSDDGSLDELYREQDLIDEINTLLRTRDRLIDQLENMPVRIIAFFKRWLRIQYPEPIYVCWSEEEGYDPSAHEAPQEIQWLYAANAVYADILNGGFFQCMMNPTGGMLPEAKKWADAAGCKTFGKVVGEFLDQFEPEIPRSADARLEAASAFPMDATEWRKMFEKLDAEFGEGQDEFYPTADSWLEKRFGIKKLKDKIRSE